MRECKINLDDCIEKGLKPEQVSGERSRSLLKDVGDGLTDRTGKPCTGRSKETCQGDCPGM